MDAQVQTYIDQLKTKYYLDNNVQKNGAIVLKEMLAVTKALIEDRKRQMIKQQNLLTKRVTRLSYLISERQKVDFNYAIEEKYDVFWKNSQELAGVSASMDDTVSKVNMTMYNAIKKLRMYKREYTELQFNIAWATDMLTFYATAKTELAAIEALL